MSGGAEVRLKRFFKRQPTISNSRKYLQSGTQR